MRGLVCWGWSRTWPTSSPVPTLASWPRARGFHFSGGSPSIGRWRRRPMRVACSSPDPWRAPPRAPCSTSRVGSGWIWRAVGRRPLGGMRGTPDETPPGAPPSNGGAPGGSVSRLAALRLRIQLVVRDLVGVDEIIVPGGQIELPEGLLSVPPEDTGAASELVDLQLARQILLGHGLGNVDGDRLIHGPLSLLFGPVLLAPLEDGDEAAEPGVGEDLRRLRHRLQEEPHVPGKHRRRPVSVIEGGEGRRGVLLDEDPDRHIPIVFSEVLRLEEPDALLLGLHPGYAVVDICVQVAQGAEVRLGHRFGLLRRIALRRQDAVLLGGRGGRTHQAHTGCREKRQRDKGARQPTSQGSDLD